MIRYTLLFVVLAMLPVLCSAQGLRYSTDKVVELSSTLVPGGTVAIDDGAGTIATEQPPFDPDPAKITAYHRIAAGDFLFVLDTAVSVADATYRAGEVLRANADSLLPEFDPVSVGLPRGAEINAVTMDNDDLVMSFDTPIQWSGSFFSDEDLIRFDGSNASMALDGSEFAIPTGSDIDAAHRADDGTWRVSFDTPGALGGIRFRDQDVLSLEPDTGSWSLAYDASAGVSGWEDAGLDAVWFEAMQVRGDAVFADRFEVSP